MKPVDLETLQADFLRHLMNGGEKIFAHVGQPERMAIYHHAYRARLVEALASDYEQLQKLAGEAAFAELCHAYIDKHPSQHFSLRWFGQDLPAFLGYAAQRGDHDWQAEMAQLEWTFIEAFDAQDVESATEMDAARVPPASWPVLSLSFHPSVRTLTLWWNTLARWRAAKDDEGCSEPQRLPEPIDCLLWRHDLTTQFRSLEADEAAALTTALAGGNFSDICGALAEVLHDQEQVPLRAAGFLKTWLNEGLITQLHI
jgi:hypothetical protein